MMKKLAGFVYNTSSVHDKMVVEVVQKGKCSLYPIEQPHSNE
ncbi:hypothetical protein [Halalkalibacter lacteus]